MGFGPRMYLVGQLPVLLADPDHDHLSADQCVKEAIRLADLTLDQMQWPNGKP